MRTKSYLFIVGLFVFVLSCKKDKDSVDNPNPPTTTEADKIKDSAIAYTRDIYLWYSQVPADFKQRNYSDPNKIMEAIRAYSKEPRFTDPVDR